MNPAAKSSQPLPRLPRLLAAFALPIAMRARNAALLIFFFAAILFFLFNNRFFFFYLDLFVQLRVV